ncbi:MAG: hypothetical protein D4R65_10100 [Verrucomicrobiaceae bacterium]|nr:MAG: hypothetical protein D4R65_10100 [Verrucomicrobiaceae bacterium]
MTTEELAAEADRIAALRADPRTPAVVRRAFLRPGGLTLRKFLALEEVGSPALDGRWPSDDAAAMAQAFCTAWEILFPGRDVPPAAELARSIAEMADEVNRGFSTVMPMRFPRAGTDGASPSQDGLGWVARFVARFTFPVDTTLDMPMDQLFILAAAQSANEGADCAGEDYRERTLPECGMRNVECEMAEGSAAGVEATGVNDTQDPEDNGRDNQGGCKHNSADPCDPTANKAIFDLPEARQDEVDRGVHGGNLPCQR